jgi:hypothetical protein
LLDPDARTVKISYRFGNGWKFLRVVALRSSGSTIAGNTHYPNLPLMNS